MPACKTAVLVAGSWGTALANVLADNRHSVKLWSRNEDLVREINETRLNGRFPGHYVLPPAIVATTSLADAVAEADAVILAAPSAAMREVARAAKPHLPPDALVIHAAKGFELGSLKRMTAVIAEELPDRDPDRLVVLSGPSHAEEVISRSPTTVVVAAGDREAAEQAQDLLISPYFRVYTNPDVTGIEVSGALKNIIALGAGMSDGLAFGDNAKAALLTRGLAEITRLGVSMGANPLTFAGLSGVGDLVVTCTSRHSRNWRAGHMLAQGTPIDEVLAKMGMVVEGVKTTKAAHELARRYQVRMPITDQLYEVLFHGKPPREAVVDLMGRGRTHEIEEIALSGLEKWLE